MIADQFLDSEEEPERERPQKRKSDLFTPEEEQMIQAAMRESVIFMASYGKGPEPYGYNEDHNEPCKQNDNG